MGLFTHVKPNVPDEIEERIKKLELKVRKLESESLDLNTTIDSLRNKVLRKIQDKRIEGEETSSSKKTPKIGEAYEW